MAKGSEGFKKVRASELPREERDKLHNALQHDLAADSVAQRARQVAQFEGTGGQDHRRRQQEGEPGGVLAGQAL